jgi:hypothetical protein
MGEDELRALRTRVTLKDEAQHCTVRYGTIRYLQDTQDLVSAMLQREVETERRSGWQRLSDLGRGKVGAEFTQCEK